MDRRSLLQQSGAAALGALALGALGAGPAEAAGHTRHPGPGQYTPLPNPAVTPVRNPPYPHGLTPCERHELRTFDELDFVVFSHAEWDRFGESHSRSIRVHMPDGSFTDGLDAHIAALKGLFAWAPDTHISEHPIRIAKNEMTAVTGVMRGTFTQPMTMQGKTIPPNGKKYALNMVTIGVWNRHGTMDEEWLFWDNLSFFQQLGLL